MKDKIFQNAYLSPLSYRDYFMTKFENLLATEKSITIHKRNSQFRMTEIYKMLNDTNHSLHERNFVSPLYSYKVNKGLK